MKTGIAADFRINYTPEISIQGILKGSQSTPTVTVLFGPSGCGKTTILRCLAGLERPDSGRIAMNDVTWFDSSKRLFVPPQSRGVGFLFQDYALFPHLTVEENIGYGLARINKQHRHERIQTLLSKFQIQDIMGRYPRQLSGGQQQRVALARALAPQPQLLLLDEPLSALDAPTRESLRAELRQWLRTLCIPAVVVTHDRAEALALADDVVVLNRGIVLQAGPVAEVFSAPSSYDAAKIVGMETVLRGDVIAVHEGLAQVVLSNGTSLLALARGSKSGDQVVVCIRGEDVILQRSNALEVSARNVLGGVVTRLTPEGALSRIDIDVGFKLTALVTRLAAEELHLKKASLSLRF